MKTNNTDRDENRYNRDDQARKGGEASINNSKNCDTDLDSDDAGMYDTETDIDGATQNNSTNRSGTYSR